MSVPKANKERKNSHKIGHFAIKCRTRLDHEVTEEVDSLFLGSINETDVENGETVDEIITDTEPP